MSVKLPAVAFEWARLDSGTVRHCVFPWPQAPDRNHVQALCGQAGQVDMDIVTAAATNGRVYTTDPSRMPECSRCMKVLACIIPPDLVRALVQESRRQDRGYAVRAGRDKTQGRGSLARKSVTRAAARAVGLPHR